MAKLLSTLPVGSIIKSTNTKYNGAVIRWIVGHQDTANGRTKLVSEKILSIKPFDAAEPNNPQGRRSQYGNNRYSQSNIDQWLNSQAEPGTWYTPRHSKDAPPNDSNVNSGDGDYEKEAGFLASFEEKFRNAILNSTIRVVKPDIDGGGYEDITRKIYLLSTTEVGFPNEKGVAEGSLWTYFNGSSSKNAYPTAEAVNKSEYKDSSQLNTSTPYKWWLRTPLYDSDSSSHDVWPNNYLHNGTASYGYPGIRPALELNSKTLVSDSADTDGAYLFNWNQPPTDPSSISYGTPQAGASLVLTTGGSTDPEGDSISYVWERKVDNGVYTQIGVTSGKTITDTVPSSGTTYYVRVKAVDSNGLESGYTTGASKAISYNTSPVISGSDQNLGTKDAPFSYNYTVTDAQSASQTITVKETLSNGSQTITIREYTATNGVQNTASVASDWLSLLPGTHILTITATDSAGGSSVRKITFSRAVTRIAASRALRTDSLVRKVFVSLYPSERPADSTLHLEVTNNPFDPNPVWVDISDKANRLVHVFTNSTVTNGNGLGYRFYIQKETQQIEVTQATVRFA